VASKSHSLDFNLFYPSFGANPMRSFLAQVFFPVWVLHRPENQLRKTVSAAPAQPGALRMSPLARLPLGRYSLLILGCAVLSLAGCKPPAPVETVKLSVGVVNYGELGRSLDQYNDLKEHLAASLKSIVEIEPAYNEIQAVQQIERQAWDVVIAPPGLAAIAISQQRYIGILPREGGDKQRSVIVVKQDSPLQNLTDLAGQTIALGQEGSATGYYLPIYNLYGLTLAQVVFPPTPKALLEAVANDKVAAGALSIAELERYRSAFSGNQFRILFRDTHPVPPGAILISPAVDRNLQQQIRQSLENAPSTIASSAGFVATGKVPDYTYMIKVVQRVRPIANRIREQPAPLY
jgi:phosphonate transport system substrate-binding protein